MKKSDVDELPLLALSDLELSRSEKKGQASFSKS
jgi:hypothetical protein